MAREIPEVVRAAAGLAATVLDEARKLPETLPGLPVRLVGLAMQKAMWLQQQYSGLVARGDELFTGLRGEDEPGLATFDEDLEAPAASGAADIGTGFPRDSAFDRVGDDAAVSSVDVSAVELSDELQGADEVLEALAIEELVDDEAAGLPSEPAPESLVDAVDSVTDRAEAAAAPSRPLSAPVDGYDDLSIAQLRGHLRGYAPKTVQELLDYEQAARAREPYLRMLRNRLERLEVAGT